MVSVYGAKDFGLSVKGGACLRASPGNRQYRVGRRTHVRKPSPRNFRGRKNGLAFGRTLARDVPENTPKNLSEGKILEPPADEGIPEFLEAQEG